jgi:hypothetical protein
MAVMGEVLGVLTGVDEEPARRVPGVSMCGSDAVIDAFVQAFRSIDQQDAAVRGSWRNLGSSTVGLLEGLVAVDEDLARQFG